MSWKEKRLITILSIILAVLCAAVLLVLSVLIGFAIITLLAYSGALSRVTWWSLGAYQLLWFIPTVLLGLVRKK